MYICLEYFACLVNKPCPFFVLHNPSHFGVIPDLYLSFLYLNTQLFLLISVSVKLSVFRTVAVPAAAASAPLIFREVMYKINHSH